MSSASRLLIASSASLPKRSLIMVHTAARQRAAAGDRYDGRNATMSKGPPMCRQKSRPNSSQCDAAYCAGGTRQPLRKATPGWLVGTTGSDRPSCTSQPGQAAALAPRIDATMFTRAG